MRRRGALAALAAASVACAGCSWIIGVSDDPVVVDSGEDAGAATDSAVGDVHEAGSSQDAADASPDGDAADAGDAKDSTG